MNCYNTSKEDFKKLNHLFAQTKWIQNDVISSDNIFKYKYKEHRIIKNFDKDRNLVERKQEVTNL